MLRSLGIHLYPTPCGMRCHCLTSWRSFFDNEAAERIPVMYTTVSNIRKVVDRNWVEIQIDITSLQTAPDHIVGKEAFFCLKRNCFQQSGRLAGHVGEDLIHIAFACK